MIVVFKITLFFMLVFFLVIAIQTHRNVRSTLPICFEGRHYWLLCNELTPNSKLKLIAYLNEPGFTYGPYIWVIVDTNDQGQVKSLTEELDEF